MTNEEFQKKMLVALKDIKEIKAQTAKIPGIESQVAAMAPQVALIPGLNQKVTTIQAHIDGLLDGQEKLEESIHETHQEVRQAFKHINALQ